MNRFLIAVLLATVAAGFPHGQGKLKLASTQLTAGGTVDLTGTEFAKKEPFAVLLVGASGRTEIGEVESDSVGKFAATLTVPAAARPGSYRLVLEASDDDEAASADVVVTAGPDTTADAHVHAEGEENQPGDSGEMPSASPLDLDRARSPLVTGGAIATIVALLVLGGMLLRRNGGA